MKLKKEHKRHTKSEGHYLPPPLFVIVHFNMIFLTIMLELYYEEVTFLLHINHQHSTDSMPIWW